MIRADVLLRGGHVLPAAAASAVIDDGAVGIHQDRVVFVGSALEADAQVHADRVIDCARSVVMPGLIDCHVHTGQETARGLADDVPVAEWLTRIVGFEAAMTEDDVVASARLACLEMIKSGTTGFIEACANPIYIDAVAEVFVESGLRANLTRSTMQHADPSWNVPDRFIMAPDANIAATEAMIRRWNGAGNGRLSAWSGWRHQQELGDDLLRRLVRLMDDHGVGLHAHLGTRQHGEIERLDRIGSLRANMVFAHAINFSPREVELIRYHNVKLDHNPGASMHGAYGSARKGQFPELLAMGVCVALGCDAAANNNTLDMFREIRLAATLHKEFRGSPDVIPAATAITMATANGARACMWDGLGVGTLAVGGKADLIVVDLRDAHVRPVHDIIGTIAYSVAGQDVVLTMVDGRILMEGRQMTFVDEEAVLQAAMTSADRVRLAVGLAS